MHPVPLTTLQEQRRGESVVMNTITAGVARRTLRTAKAAWAIRGELQHPSKLNPLTSRQNAITILIDRIRNYSDGAAIPSNTARAVLVEVGADASRIGPKPMNTAPARRVFTPR